MLHFDISLSFIGMRLCYKYPPSIAALTRARPKDALLNLEIQSPHFTILYLTISLQTAD